MSWAEEDWTVGLSGRVLQKVKELQVHQERLSRENKQKQLQLDNIHTSLEKQTVKYEEVRGELQSVQRELQSVREEAKAAVTSRERLTQEVQTKQAQVCSLEGQLDATRTLNNKLSQDIKRLEAELEKLQNSSRLADTTLFSTPCWSTTSPWEHNGSRQEERTGQRDEGQSRQRLQFSDMSTPLERQQHKSTPHRLPSGQLDTSTPLAAFPWERDDSRPACRRRLPPSPQMLSHDATNQSLSKQGNCGKDSRTETDKMRSHVSALEEELSERTRTLKSVLNEQVQSKKELAAKELSLQRARDELSKAQTRMAQDNERASAAEHRLKQLQEELKCQRQNAESSRLQHQQRTKELEKQHQRDLTELQKERQCLERQHQQEVNKLNQELQQARTLHNALQAQADKLSLQKQALDKELDSLKEKLKWTEGQLKESQKKEMQTQAKLTEAVRQAEGVTVSLEQSRKKERALEEEGRRLAEERADALRLLKELQEQKPAPAPLPQTVQFCPVGQSFSPQSSFSHPSRPSTHTKRLAAAQSEQKRVEEDDLEGRRVAITPSYPTDREPGEGIDSEHITTLTSPDSECLVRTGHREKGNEMDNQSRNEAITCEISRPDSCSSHSAADTPITTSVVDDGVIDLERSPLVQSLRFSAEKTTSVMSKEISPSEDLKRENAMLRSELQDVREELQKRLEDLEAQRRAETEARTRLKQLSRKHARQAAEEEEKNKELRAQVESERAETERLKKITAALEAEMETEREKGDKKDRQEEEKNEDRESEMIELNIQLKKQLAEVKAQLALEREERKQEERNQMTNTDTDVKKELNMKVAELTAEVEELKCRIKENLQEEEKLSAANRPLTYLSLHDDELNSNILYSDKLLPSPEQHLLFCQSTNQRNMLVSQSAAEIIQEGLKVFDSDHPPLSDDAQTDRLTDLEDSRQGELFTSDLAKEVEHLQNERAKETERANQYQVKLEALQSQVTRQTQQLTSAFEKQSQHISGLLAELQEKESALLSQGNELLRCKEELEALKNDKEGEEKGQKGEWRDETLAEISELQPKQEKECAVTCHTDNPQADDATKGDASQPKIVTCDATTTAPVCSEEDNEALQRMEHPDSVDLNKTVMAENQCSQRGETADVVALQRENQLLKQRIEDLTISDTRNPSLQTDSENRQAVVKQSQNAGNAAASCLTEQKTHTVPNDVTAEGKEVLLQNVRRSEDEEHDIETEDGKTTRAEEDLEDMSEDQVNHLHEQVEALQMKIRSLSEEMQQQAEELSLWRLSSQPTPTFDMDEQWKTQEQISTVKQSYQQQTDEMTQSQAQTLTVQTQVHSPTWGNQRRQDTITVIREDELLLGCSSNKLQGHMLFSRLQNSNLLEPKSIHASKNTTFQEHSEDTANIDQECEKENHEINILQRSDASPTQHKAKRDTGFFQMSAEEMLQRHLVKDPHKVSGANLTKTDFHVGKTEAKLNSSKETNEISTIGKSSDRDVKTDMRSVSSQTDKGLYLGSALRVCVSTQTEEEVEEEDEEEIVDSPPVSPGPLPEKAGSENKMLFAGSFPIPADPARLAERIRRNRTQLSAAFDDTEYEPYGLPEVVMKGFADIPSGPSCPYIVRRGLLGTTVVPVTQKESGEEEEMD